jgi:hypothetical protein
MGYQKISGNLRKISHLRIERPRGGGGRPEHVDEVLWGPVARLQNLLAIGSAPVINTDGSLVIFVQM